MGENRLIFALDPKQGLDAESLILHSGPKFLCFIVDFYKYFWFWYQTENVSEKVYAAIWPVLEITSLNGFFSGWKKLPQVQNLLHLQTKMFIIPVEIYTTNQQLNNLQVKIQNLSRIVTVQARMLKTFTAHPPFPVHDPNPQGQLPVQGQVTIPEMIW